MNFNLFKSRALSCSFDGFFLFFFFFFFFLNFGRFFFFSIFKSAEQTSAEVHELNDLVLQLTQDNVRLVAENDQLREQSTRIESDAARVKHLANEERRVCMEMCSNFDREQAALDKRAAKIKAEQDRLVADKRELASLMREVDKQIAAQQQRDIELAQLRKELADERQQRAMDKAFEDELGKLNEALEQRVASMSAQIKELEARDVLALLPPPPAPRTVLAPTATANTAPVAAAPRAQPATVIPKDRRKSIGIAAGQLMASDQLQQLEELENLMTPRAVKTRSVLATPSTSTSKQQQQQSTRGTASVSRLRQPSATPARR
jgi:myosin heavy subunit